LGTALLALLVTFLGVTAVTDGTETIANALRIESANAEWIFKAYALSFAALLFVGGKLGDMFGRRKALLVGLATFVVGSVAAGASSDAGWLIGFRVLQGAGAALVLPVTLSLILDAFPRRGRGAAFGFWTAVLAVAYAGGIALSGTVIDDLGWRWLFYGGAVLAAVAALFAFRFVAKDSGRAGRFDFAGALTGTGALAALGFAVLQGQQAGWDSPLIIALFGLTVSQSVAFVLVERHQPAPLIDIGRLCSRDFGVGSLIVFLASAGILGGLFVTALQFEQVFDYSAGDTAIAVLPFAIALTVVAPFAGKLADRFDERLLTAVGLLLASGGLWGLSTVEASTGRGDLAIPLVVLGLGAALALPAVTNVALDRTAPAEYGAASGVFGGARNMGALVGIAVAGAVFVCQVGTQVPKAVADGVQQGTSEQLKTSIKQNGVDLLKLDEDGAGLTGTRGARPGLSPGLPLPLRPFPPQTRAAEQAPVLGTVAQALPFKPGNVPTKEELEKRQKQVRERQKELRKQQVKQQEALTKGIDQGLSKSSAATFRYLSIFTLLAALATIYLGRTRRSE
jgi:EmrB/QacA subfamily drug resistance transporter